MNPNDPNVVMIELVANRLGETLRNDMIFVGGAIAGLLITDPAFPAIRPTEDVDLIVEVLARNDYYQIEKSLVARGFVVDQSENAPICRWKIESVIVDVMPTDEAILGFANRWYLNALHSAEKITLPSGIWIRRISAPMFLATKLEAFEGRGNNDYLFSHDLGDLLALIDGRDELVEECVVCSVELKSYLRVKIGRLLSTPAFLQALSGHLPGDQASQERVPDLMQKLGRLSKLNRREVVQYQMLKQERADQIKISMVNEDGPQAIQIALKFVDEACRYYVDGEITTEPVAMLDDVLRTAGHMELYGDAFQNRIGVPRN